MDALQQRCRPKHQVLVLKCYPRITKGAVDVKPNSSELSYLLFYSTSRRSKIQKVGSFLEKKTATDVWRLRIGNVQVTLQILAALIEKSPKDLPLFAHIVLKVLDLVLRSRDITMVEASLPTFETFCQHHDASSLFADQTYVRQYEDVVRTYATFASTRQTPGKGQASKPVALRWRSAGLAAIRSVAASEALSSIAGRQLNTIVPMILENLWTDNEEFLNVLLQRAEREEKTEPGNLVRRRTSTSTVRTPERESDPNPIALFGSAGDVDKLAEEDIGVVAIQCLKQIFVIPNRAQIYGATQALLSFVRERVRQDEELVRTDPNTGRDSGWAIKLCGLVARWAPVQDRYVILVTLLDGLVTTQPNEEYVQHDIVLAAMISSLLRSDVNLIGLSVMDVLLGLLQHMKRVLKWSSGSSRHPSTASGTASASRELAQNISPQHKELLDRIVTCIGDLATHVYYADQISDMIAAIFLLLKPHGPASALPSAEKNESVAAPRNSATNLSEDQQQLDSLFSLDVAKTAVLKAVKSILLVANPVNKTGGNVSLSRNRVPVQVWEGTHWLLRDPEGQVRKAYADALITWLDRETTPMDLRARDETAQRPSRHGHGDERSVTFARRAVSNASARDRPVRVPRSRFLQLLHLAIYDNALQFVDFETDICLLHVVLAKLVYKLGVNVVRFGLPMVFRLQEDIQEAETPLAKVRLGSLCHGYFWALSEKFDFESSVVGRAIHNEISRRRSKSFWVEGVQVPPSLLELVGTPGMARPQPKLPLEHIESEALLPFDDRLTMVDCICTNYQEIKTSPAVSPSASPGRTFAHPILSSPLSSIPPAGTDQELPAKFREDMLTEWTREAAVMALQEGSKSASLNGSKTGTTTTRGNRLTVNGQLANGNGHTHGQQDSPHGSHQNMRAASQPPAAGLLAVPRKPSVRSRGSERSSSKRGFVASVNQLRSVLSGEPPRPGTFPGGPDDDSSESLTSYDVTPSEASFNTPQGDTPEHVERPSLSVPRARSKTGEAGGPLTSNPTQDQARTEERGEDGEGDTVPPVPPLPSSIAGRSAASEGGHSRPASTAAATPSHHRRRNVKSRGGDSILSSGFADSGAGGMDVQSLLKAIDSRSRETSMGNVAKPPY